MHYLKQMNSGRWHVLRTAHSTAPVLQCEHGSYSTKAAAAKALNACRDAVAKLERLRDLDRQVTR